MAFTIKGIIPAMVTPLRDDDEQVDEQALRKVVNFLIEGGVHGLFAVGSQGEFYALTPAERERVTATTVEEAAGRVPVYVGTGGITTAECIQITRRAAELGAAAASVITPYFVRPTQKELIKHYSQIADAVTIPVLLYNNPTRTGVNIDADTVKELAKHSNIAGVKDSSGNFGLTEDYILATRGMDFNVVAGNDALICATLLMGGAGSIAATANAAPRLVVSIYDAVMAGDIPRAREQQLRLLPLRKAFDLGTFPVVIKEAMRLIGVSAGPARSPVGPISAEMRARLKGILAEMGLLAAALAS